MNGELGVDRAGGSPMSGGRDDVGLDQLKLVAQEQRGADGDVLWVALLSVCTHSRSALDRLAENLGCELDWREPS
jgi:hypothetical protein